MSLVHWQQNDLEVAAQMIEESRAVWGELGDRRNLAYAVVTQGLVAVRQGKFDAARRFYREALDVLTDCRSAGD